MDAGTPSLPEFWSKTVTLAKDRVNNRSFWEALENATPITIENDTLIIGFNANIFNQAGHLTVADHRNAIEIVISQLAGRRLQFRIIEGDSVDDWNHTKRREERVATLRTTTYQKRDREDAASQSWEALNEYVARAYSGTAFRSLPQMKARFLVDMLYVLADAMDQLYPAQPDEATERHLARVIERIAGNAEVPAAAIALELDRLRAWRAQTDVAKPPAANVPAP